MSHIHYVEKERIKDLSQENRAKKKNPRIS